MSVNALIGKPTINVAYANVHQVDTHFKTLDGVVRGSRICPLTPEQDDLRADLMADLLLASDSSIIAASECLYQRLWERMNKKFTDNGYISVAPPPQARGIGSLATEIYERWPDFGRRILGEMGENIDWCLEYHAAMENPGNRSSLGALMVESWFPLGLRKALDLFMGAGQVFDSGVGLWIRGRDFAPKPIIQSPFYEHSVHPKWEVMTGKGVQEVRLRLPEKVAELAGLDDDEFKFATGHFGETVKAIRAQQIAEAFERGASLFVADFNLYTQADEASVERYLKRMKDASERKEPTYSQPNFWELRDKSKPGVPLKAQLDRMYYDPRKFACRRFQVLSPGSQIVLPNGTIISEQDYRLLINDESIPITDHFPIFGEFELLPPAQVVSLFEGARRVTADAGKRAVGFAQGTAAAVGAAFNAAASSVTRLGDSVIASGQVAAKSVR